MTTTTLANDYMETAREELGVFRQLRFPFLSRLPLGLRSLDIALVGGIPKGHVSQIIGRPDTARTTLAYHLLAQNDGVFIDVDGSYDPTYAHAIGATPCVATTVEFPAINEVIIEFLKAGELVIVDSLASIVGTDEERSPRAYIECEIPNWRYLASEYQGTLVLIDQLRFDPDTKHHIATTCGPMVMQQCAMRLHTKPSNVSSIEVVVARDFHHPTVRSTFLDLEEGRGISRTGSWLDAALARGEVVRKGSWYAWPSGKLIAQGRADTLEALRACI